MCCHNSADMAKTTRRQPSGNHPSARPAVRRRGGGGSSQASISDCPPVNESENAGQTKKKDNTTPAPSPVEQNISPPPSTPVKSPSQLENHPTPNTDSTKQPSLPRQQEECKDRERFHRQIENQILRIRLRRRIEKIWQLSADVVEGYGKYYQRKYKRPLPVDVIVKIETLFLHRVERRCAELGLSVYEEKQWSPDAELLEQIYLTDSGEESEEHDSDDVVFDSRSESDDEQEDNENDD